jgi:hypothetical protein
MWEPQRLTTLWSSTACYRDSLIVLIEDISNARTTNAATVYMLFETDVFFMMEHASPDVAVWTSIREVLGRNSGYRDRAFVV